MKRAGDEPAATQSKPAKQQKTVTFLLPTKRPRSPDGGPATKAARPRVADDGRSGSGSMPPPPPQQPGGYGYGYGGALDRQTMSSSQHSAGAGSLGRERDGAERPSRFSFDFMDDSLSSRSKSSRGDASLSAGSSHGHGGAYAGLGNGSVQSSSPRAGSGSRRWDRPSPNRSDRLDARYSSRLPPSYARGRSDARWVVWNQVVVIFAILTTISTTHTVPGARRARRARRRGGPAPRSATSSGSPAQVRSGPQMSASMRGPV